MGLLLDIFGDDDLVIRPAQKSDLSEILKIYEQARRKMIRSGNPDQWKDSRPSQADVCEDIERGKSYVAVYGQEIAGVFAFIIGDDPTYKKSTADGAAQKVTAQSIGLPQKTEKAGFLTYA